MGTITAWRIVQTRHEADAFSGTGAWLEGGRWNPKGVRMVYTSESIALAALEILVNLPNATLLFNFYTRIPVEFDENQVITIDKSSLTAGWNASPPTDASQNIGRDWIKNSQSPILCVPSVVIPDEYNYLINPYHADFSTLKIGKAQPFKFDRRLKRILPSTKRPI
jgi:RES domain-containing protein